jgi:hypothetical protein
VCLAVAFCLASLGPSSHAVDARTMGQATDLQFGGAGYVTQTSIVVKKGWLNSDQFHGNQVETLSAPEVFGTDQDIAIVDIPWTADNAIHETAHEYDVTVRVIAGGKVLTSTTTVFVL